MTFHVTIQCDNAAFEDCKEDEVANILRDQVGLMLEASEKSRPLRDSNGNIVGTAYFAKE